LPVPRAAWETLEELYAEGRIRAIGVSNFLQHPALNLLAQKYQRSPAQIVLRWDIQRGLVVIPKSSHQNRIAENIKLFDFALSPEDMQLLQSLNLNLRVGPGPG
jgi:diketogulonate reductase-like aldo/keto reductase